LGSLVCDGKGHLFSCDDCSNNFYQFDIGTNTWSWLGTIGPYMSGGDLTYFNGVLYLSTTTSAILAITISPFSYTLSSQMNISNVWGINTVSISTKCSYTQKMIACSNSDIYYVDPTTGITTPVCMALPISGGIYGATSTVGDTTIISMKIKVTATSGNCISPIGSATVTVTTTPIPPYTYSWSPSGGTNATATGLSSGTYTVIVTDANGCTSNGTVIIAASNGPTATASVGKNVSCNGNSTGSASATQTGGTAPLTYSWNTIPAQTTTAATGLAAGTYSVVVTDAKGCTSTASVIISQPKNPLTINTTSSGSNCGGSGATGSASVDSTRGGTAPYTYSWNTIPPQTTSSVSNLPVGNYSITVTDANGCTVQNAITIANSVQPNALFSSTQSMSCEGVSVQISNTSTQATGYTWNFGDQTTSTQQNPVHTYPSGGTFVITLVAENPPCKDTVAATVVIGDLSPLHIGAANVFTPNGDGKNDCFTLAPDTAYAIKHCLYLEIFDRWGIKMFESSDSDICWDGKNHKDNKQAVDGTYYYIAKLGGTTIKGYVTLIR
jgi:gliding motility-associated-like protein